MEGYPSVCILRKQVKSCQNPIQCKRKHSRWKRNQSKFIPIGEQELERFRENFIKESAEFKLSKHFKKRSYQRSISKRDLDEVMEFGWVIERNISQDQDIFLTLLVYTSDKRPLHIVFRVDSDTFWVVVTGYTPKSDHRKWDNGYQERVCFCQ